MAASYDVYVRHEVAQTLRSIPRARRDQIVGFMESLTTDPFQPGDFLEHDRTGRSCQVRVLGKYAVFFWADHAVKEVKVVDLVDADSV